MPTNPASPRSPDESAPPSAGAAHGRPAPAPDPAREQRRNERLGVWNGALYQFGEGFIDSNTVVPVFLSRLTASNTLIGIGTSLAEVGWLLPQFLVTPWVVRMRRQLEIYRAAAVVRAVALGTVAALMWPLADRPQALLVAFFIGYGIYCFGAGVGALSFVEVVGRVVPHERLGRFWSSRLFWGGSLVAVAGLFVRRILEWPDPAMRFGVLFALATVLVSIAYGLFGAIREPDHPPGESVDTPLDVLREGFRMLREDPPFRRLLVGRASLAAWSTTAPFMVLFTVHDLGGGPRAAGTFLLARVAGFVLSNLAWPRIADRHGSRGVMRISAAIAIGVTLGAAVVGVISPWLLGWIPAPLAVSLLEALAVAGGAAQAGFLVSYGSLLFQLAPTGRRQMFVSLTNTFVAISMLAPPLGGLLVDLVNAPFVFALCSGLAYVGWRATRRLPETRGMPAESVQEELAGG